MKLMSQDYYIGSNREEILENFGHSFNDVHSNEWSYRLPATKGIFPKRYIHFYFKNNKVTEVRFSRTGRILNWT